MVLITENGKYGKNPNQGRFYLQKLTLSQCYFPIYLFKKKVYFLKISLNFDGSNQIQPESCKQQKDKFTT